MSNYKKALEVKKMTDIMSKIEKETQNTEVESLSKYGFVINLNVAGDLQSVTFEDQKHFSDELGFAIAEDLEKTIKKIIDNIKIKRLEITEKYKKDLEVKPGFRGF